MIVIVIVNIIMVMIIVRVIVIVMIIVVLVIIIQHDLSSKQRDPNPKDNSLTREETSKHKGLHFTFAALLFLTKEVFVRVRVSSFAAQELLLKYAAWSYRTAYTLIEVPAIGFKLAVHIFLYVSVCCY